MAGVIPSVKEKQAPLLLGRSDLDHSLGPGTRVLDGVRQQVGEHYFHQGRIALHKRQRFKSPIDVPVLRVAALRRDHWMSLSDNRSPRSSPHRLARLFVETVRIPHSCRD